VNPTQLLEPRAISNLPSARALWTNHSTRYYERFDLSFTGFLINGASGPMTDDAERMYIPFSPFGAVEQTGYAPGGKSGVHLQQGVPFFQGLVLFFFYYFIAYTRNLFSFLKNGTWMTMWTPLRGQFSLETQSPERRNFLFIGRF
jgi:hypothetical protein